MMHYKLTDLPALENITIAAYDIPENVILVSKVKYTKTAGKNNGFLSGPPSEALDRDLEVLSVMAHRISCTYSFKMNEQAYKNLINVFLKQPNFDEKEKRGQDNHCVFYVNKRKFTLSYFKKKGITAVYAGNDLFDTYIAEFFVDQSFADTMSEKKEPISKNNRREKNTLLPVNKKQAPASLTALPSGDNDSSFLPQWSLSDIAFRINRIVVNAEKLKKETAKEIEKIIEKSNNSVSIKKQKNNDKSESTQVTLTSNINNYLIEAVDYLKKTALEPLNYEIRFPMRTTVWKFLNSRNWLDRAKREETRDGFTVRNSSHAIHFKRNDGTGICEMTGCDSELFYQCILRLEDIFENTVDERRIEQDAIRESIRQKLPYTIKILKDQSEAFINLISPSFVLLNDTGIELTDYSPMVFSVYRGVELYLKYLADQSGIDLNGQPIGNIFKRAPKKGGPLNLISDSIKGTILESIFENFSDYRNTLFHANLDEVLIIGSREAAEDICINALQNLEAASFQFHLEEMTITI